MQQGRAIAGAALSSTEASKPLAGRVGQPGNPRGLAQREQTDAGGLASVENQGGVGGQSNGNRSTVCVFKGLNTIRMRTTYDCAPGVDGDDCRSEQRSAGKGLGQYRIQCKSPGGYIEGFPGQQNRVPGPNPSPSHATEIEDELWSGVCSGRAVGFQGELTFSEQAGSQPNARPVREQRSRDI